MVATEGLPVPSQPFPADVLILFLKNKCLF